MKIRVPRKTKKVLKTFVNNPPTPGSRAHRRFMRFWPKAVQDMRRRAKRRAASGDWSTTDTWVRWRGPIVDFVPEQS